MAIITFEPAPDIVLENMNAQRKYVDGVLSAIRVYANDGYDIYDTAANDIEFVEDPETGDLIERPVTYYYTMVTVPAAIFNVDTFTWVAVPRSDVDENYIFGGGDNNNHEVM